jgi:hypothetical protein
MRAQKTQNQGKERGTKIGFSFRRLVPADAEQSLNP